MTSATEKGVKLCEAAHGTLTAEQVRKAIFVGGIWDEDNAMYYVNRTDMQTIADELNAMLGSGTCENIAPEYLDFLCSKCGFVHYHSDENDSGDENEWAFCPNCCAKVVGA